MSVYFSSPSNDSLPFSPNSSINSALPFAMDCYVHMPNSIIFSLFNITNIFLLLPLCIFILHHGLQQWRKSRSTSSASMSHSDSFTYHLVTMEIIGVFGCFLNVCAIHTGQLSVLTVGLYLLSLTYFGEMFFHILTCLERYLAVVHPVTYLSLRKERGIRIRNICIGCVWLLCFMGLGFLNSGSGDFLIMGMNLFILTFSLTSVSFCSVSVLCVLIHPGPGEQSRGRVDQSKQRAFYTIVSILGMVVLRFVWDLVGVALDISENSFNCVALICTFWVYIPSSLVLPFLFLLTKKKMKRKPVCCKFCSN